MATSATAHILRLSTLHEKRFGVDFPTLAELITQIVAATVVPNVCKLLVTFFTFCHHFDVSLVLLSCVCVVFCDSCVCKYFLIKSNFSCYRQLQDTVRLFARLLVP